jgi:hypothetical protein
VGVDAAGEHVSASFGPAPRATIAWTFSPSMTTSAAVVSDAVTTVPPAMTLNLAMCPPERGAWWQRSRPRASGRRYVVPRVLLKNGSWVGASG